MRCSEATRQLQLYLDSQLSMQQVRRLEAHLAGCHACRNELSLLEAVTYALREVKPVVEPADLAVHIMQRVAVTPQRRKRQYSLLRPSFWELLAVVLLATITTLGIIWEQPSLRAALPLANGHDMLSQVFLSILAMLMTGNTLALWVGGTILGVCITLALAGNEVRTQWFKAMMGRLPVR